MESERRQKEPVIWLTVTDSDGNTVKRIEGPTKKGFHRVAWDLRFPNTSAIDTKGDVGGGNQNGVMAAPGHYTVTLSKQIDGTVTILSDPLPFEVERMRKGALEGSDIKDVAGFWQQLAKLQRATTAASLVLRNTLTRVDAMRVALSRTRAEPGDLDKQLYELRQTLLALDEQINGNRSKRQVGEEGTPTVSNRLRFAMGGTRLSTYGPTPNLQRSLEIASSQFAEVQSILDGILKQQLPDMERALSEAGAPWVEGQPIPKF